MDKTRVIKKQNRKRRKENITLSQKIKIGQKNFDKKTIRENESKINFLTYKLLT
jgi:hypothetical protein